MPRSTPLAAAVAALLVLAAPAAAAPVTTAERTFQDCNGDNRLEPAPGERHLSVPAAADRDDDACAEDEPGSRLRLPRTASLLNFLQLSDFQMVDEESPARVEFFDSSQRIPGLNPFSAAYRPQETLTTQVTEAMVRQARNTVSPVTGAPLDLTILTGDNADSQQFNETRWFIDILDGTTGPENPDPEMDDRPGADRKIVPDSGIPSLVPGCGAPVAARYSDNGSIYDGVRGGGRPGMDTGYYEPDGEDDGDGYTPDRTRNQAEVPGPQADVTVRDFPGLFEAAQQPFEAVGLGMPWYSAFGNHDALVQGNSPEAYAGPLGPSGETVNPAFDAIARGCLKPSNLPDGVTIEEYLSDPEAALGGSAPVVVPPDPRRCFVAKSSPMGAGTPCDTGGWIEQHTRTTGFPVGHGFEAFASGAQAGAGRPPDARANHDGYYSFQPRPGYRFVVLDTITDECGALVCAEGSIDDPQYRWAERELAAADAADERVLVFSHHTLRTIRFESTDPTERPIHYGERLDRKSQPPRPVRPDAVDTLEDLWCRHPSLVGHVVGHEHENYVLPHKCEDPGQGPNTFYEISTAAHIDFPQQSRMIEFADVGGQLTLVLTILDHAGPANPGNGSGEEPVKLASIAREIAYNDYQGNRGARGSREDRNVVIPLARPASATGLLALTQRTRLARDRRFAFPFAAAPGTRARLTFRAPDGTHLGRARVRVPVTGRTHAQVRLTRRGAALLRRSGGRVRVTVRASLQREAGGRAVRRTARITLTGRR